MYAVLALGLLFSPPQSATDLPPFNAIVLSLIASDYPDESFGGYAWPAPRGTHGMTRDLFLGKQRIARGSGEGGNHCVGITFEIFWRALDKATGGDPAKVGLTARKARAMLREWFVPVDGGPGVAKAIPQAGLGRRVTRWDDARPGDFVQVWMVGGFMGHSMVFLGWERDRAGNITGMRYWSSQPWTDGIGESRHPIDADDPGAIDPAQVHLVRVVLR